MSYRKEKQKSLLGIDVNHLEKKDLQELSQSALKSGIHGLCFSPYEEGQEPGDPISEAQIRKKIEIILPYTKWIRTFSCTEGNEQIPKIAKEYGLKTLVGAWLGDDNQVNENEIKGLIALSKAGFVDVAAVGNEVMYRGDLEEAELISFINHVKKEIPNIPVGYVDAYYEFSDRPKITEVCDVILANCYPYWEGCSLEYSLVYMKQMYQQALNASNGKKVIITETGWPSKGTSLEGAHPSYDNALRYFINAQKWSKEDAVEMFYFSSFDESWKVDAEGDVGAYWGLWDKDENLKF
ncbi:glycosyl hydrolase family 17 protein [Flavobacteriaceae bacterium]|nr:glycosyl hydrolase family 17 protein [Flavobacteriaceae bacterium]